MNDSKDNTKKDYKKEYKKLQPKWIIDADLNETQFAEACNLLDSGMKVRKVALRFGIHRNKIKRI